MKTEDYYYIDTGSQSKMYTLRHHYFEKSAGGLASERDFYCCNLSINWNKALNKAKAMCNGALREMTKFDLEEIRRRRAEEIEEERITAQRVYDERQNILFNNFNELIKQGMYPFGNYVNKPFKNQDCTSYAPMSYVRYMINLEIEGTERFDCCMVNLQKALIKNFPEAMIRLPEPNGEYYEFNKREKFLATVIAEFSFPSDFGIFHILKMVKDSGELIVYKGTSLPEIKTVLDNGEESYADPEVGKMYTFDAALKRHETYKDEKQTIVQRITKFKFAK